MNKYHRNETIPNRILAGYLHVSKNGPYSSTLVVRPERDKLSRRQRLKRDKLVRRLIKADREAAS